MDLKGVLNENPEAKKSKSESIRTHKKPMQLRDIESRSATNKHHTNIDSEEDIGILLEKEKQNIYKKKWNKLDQGLKLNRIKLFVDNYEDINEEQKKQLTDLLIKACKANKLNRNSDILYDSETCEIKEIKILKRKDDLFTLNIVEVKKKQSTGRSKTNIERLLKS